jgi:uncharacterized protein
MTIKYKICLMGGLCLLLSACSMQTYDGFLSTNRKDNGSPSYQRGMHYLLGQGVTQNDQQAFFWIKKAALAGDPLAENELAYLYAVGKGVELNYPEAVKWYTNAANHGLSSSAYNLSIFYREGLGVEKDPQKAHEWLEIAAKRGFAPAQVALNQAKQ